MYLLCKDNRTISLQECLRSVAELGSIDLAILFQAASHLLPPRKRSPQEHYPAALNRERIEDGFVDREEASMLLSHRQTTRPGDGPLIWSLLSGTDPFKDALQLWRATLGGWQTIVRSGFLVSSVPRVEGLDGFTWAPRQPSCDRTKSSFYFPSGNFNRTQWASFHDDKLAGRWGVHIFDVYDDSPANSSTSQREIRIMVRSNCNDDARYEVGALLQPLSQIPIGGIEGRFTAVRCHNGSHETMFGVCGSVDGSVWKWVGVYSWKSGNDLPCFEVKDFFIS